MIYCSSALLSFYAQGRLTEISGVTRTHTLAEMYGTMTGRGFVPDGGTEPKRWTGELAARVVSAIAGRLQFVDMDAPTVLKALKAAEKRGVRAGRVHDYLHALAAEKASADELWTTDKYDFAGLGKVPVKVV